MKFKESSSFLRYNSHIYFGCRCVVVVNISKNGQFMTVNNGATTNDRQDIFRNISNRRKNNTSSNRSNMNDIVMMRLMRLMIIIVKIITTMAECARAFLHLLYLGTTPDYILHAIQQPNTNKVKPNQSLEFVWSNLEIMTKMVSKKVRQARQAGRRERRDRSR